ncbi:hypothetical protein [Streptomyces sp. NPDC042319]|uniref:hypothetical protein n=1 Tax=Streptomyces sp. NPDC042319 TaxID=3154332 RepID=UPI0033FD02F7
MKYCQALAARRSGHLELTEEGQSPERSYRAMQAGELGRAFGLLAAERAVRQRFPERLISTVDADTVLLAGFARAGSRPTLGARPRPDYLIEAWMPGEPSSVFAITVNGNQQVATERTSKPDRSAFRQLARGSERAEHFHLGKWNTTPCLLLSTELLAREGITINALHSPGAGQLPVRPPSGRGSANVAGLAERNIPYASAVRLPPAEEGGKERHHDAFAVPTKNLAWFGQVLARTAAGAQLAFAGAGREVAQYLTDKQGRRYYQQHTFAGSSSVHDASHEFGSTRFVGTDHVFRLGGVRVEAFSGMSEELYDLLADGEVEQYRCRAYALRNDWPSDTTALCWGPVSFRQDGTVMALRVLPDSSTGVTADARRG